jgi:outer membrane lipase/esterase
MRRQLLAGAALACAALAAGSAAAQTVANQTYSRVVVFGDSLTDNGNLFRLTGGREPASPPYFQGRFSNGPTFVELLGFNLGGFGTATGSTSYAFGGARTDTSQSPPGLRTQLGAYLAGGGQFGPNDLVIVYGGANNIFQGVPGAAASANPIGTLQALTGSAAADIGFIINTAAQRGAGTVLVPNLPSLGATPQFNGFNPAGAPARDLAEGATIFLNAATLAQANAASAANVQTNFIYMDVNRFDAFVRANPSAFGFTNITTPCLNLTTGVPCANPDQFLYFDTVHPTAAGHRGLAALTQDYLTYGARGAAAAALGETSLDHREAAQDAALERLGEGPGGGGVRFSLHVQGAQSTQDARGDVPEIERDTGLIAISGDGILRPGVFLGLQGHAAHSTVDAGPLSVDVESLGVDAYLGLENGPIFVNLVLGGSTDSYSDYRRATGVGPLTHSADRIDGASFGGKLQAGYRFALGGGELSPRAALSAVKVEVDPFNENGASARHAHRAVDVEALTGEAALRYETDLGRFRAHLEGGYAELLSYDGDVFTALVDNPARPLGREIDEPGRGALLKAGLTGEIAPGLNLGVSYHGQFDDSRDGHAARLTVTYRPGS